MTYAPRARNPDLFPLDLAAKQTIFHMNQVDDHHFSLLLPLPTNKIREIQFKTQVYSQKPEFISVYNFTFLTSLSSNKGVGSTAFGSNLLSNIT